VDRLRKAHEEIQAKREDSAAGGSMASPEVMAALEALGYMSTDGNVGDEETAKLDAKDQTELIQKLDRARTMSRRGKVKRAIALYESVIAEHPQIAEARMNLSRAMMRVGRKEDGIKILEEAIERDPSSTVLKSNLAGAFAQTGQPEKAMELFKAILLQVPGDEVARNGIVSTLIESARFDEALANASEWSKEDPENRTWDAHLGVVLARMNRIQEALPHLQRAIEDDMPRAQVHATLAAIAVAGGDAELALSHLQQESDWFPQNLAVRMQIASIHMKYQRWEEAASEYGYVAQARRQDPIARRMWAQAIFNTGDYPAAEEILAPAVEFAPDDAYVLLMQANILQKMGKEEEAQVVFARATEIHEEMLARQKAAQAEEQIGPMGDLSDDPEQEMAGYGIPE
jgi:tetratricopeptide (TPR) repeat protein